MPSGSVDLAGKIIDRAGNPKVGLTVALYEAATWEAAGAATATDTSDSDGLWNFDAQDITKTWIVVAVDGTQKTLIDARNKIQLTNIDLIDDLSVDTIYEHTATSGVTIDSLLIQDGGFTLAGAVAGGDQTWTNVGDMTFAAGSILASGSTNGNTLLLRANDTTFITLTTGATDACTMDAITMSGTWIASGTVTMPALTLGGAIAGGDQTWTNVGDMTFAAGSILASGSTNGNTLLLRANDTTFITLTTGATDACTMDAITMSGTWIASGTVTMPALTLGGAVAGGDQAFTGVGDMTFTAGSILASGSTNGNTLLLRANDTTFITLTTGATDVCTMDAITASGAWLASGTWTLPAFTLGGTVTGGNNDLTAIGFIGFANTSVSANDIIIGAHDFGALGDNNGREGIDLTIQADKTASTMSGVLIGLNIKAQVHGGNTQNWTNAVGVRGIASWVNSMNSSSGTITGMAAFYADAEIKDAATVTNYYGLYVTNAAISGTKLTNQFGIYIADQTSGATLDYGLYIAGADTAAICIASADPIQLGVAGSSTGTMNWQGATSGVVTMTVAAAAGTWTFTLPPDNGDAGEQLQTNGSGVTTWEAQGSLRAFKNIYGELQPKDALDAILGTRSVLFNYRKTTLDGGRAITTGDFETMYTGVLGDEAPWAMHHNGKIFSPVNAFGYTVAAFHAIDERLAAVEEANRILRKQLEEAELIPQA